MRRLKTQSSFGTAEAEDLPFSPRPRPVSYSAMQQRPVITHILPSCLVRGRHRGWPELGHRTRTRGKESADVISAAMIEPFRSFRPWSSLCGTSLTPQPLYSFFFFFFLFSGLVRVVAIICIGDFPITNSQAAPLRDWPDDSFKFHLLWSSLSSS